MLIILSYNLLSFKHISQFCNLFKFSNTSLCALTHPILLPNFSYFIEYFPIT